jgi:hypothetical protein
MTDFLSVASTVDPAGIFLSWGIFSIQLGNLLVILAMFAVFIAALFVPFPGGRPRK